MGEYCIRALVGLHGRILHQGFGGANMGEYCIRALVGLTWANIASGLWLG